MRESKEKEKEREAASEEEGGWAEKGGNVAAFIWWHTASGAFSLSPFLALFLAASQIIWLDLFIAVFVAQACRVFLVADY